MAGDGDIELNQERAYSQDADKLKRNASSVNSGNESNLNPTRMRSLHTKARRL
ncbi:MAG: hypothetical protein ABR985_22610 [Methanotrichaceae archaeon]|jgi:hypothetical protein